MLQIRKINSRSHRACRSLFWFLEPLSHETLDFHQVRTAQHVLLSNQRAVTLFISMRKEKSQQMYALPRRECIFRSYCTSRPRGVPKLRNSVLTFGAVDFFLCSAPSVRVTLLTFAAPPVWESNFCECSFWMCCWRSSFSPPASFRNSSITHLQMVTINYILF